MLFILSEVISRSSFQQNDHPSVAMEAASSISGTMPNGVPMPLPESYQNDVLSLGAALLKPQNGFAFAFEFVSILAPVRVSGCGCDCPKGSCVNQIPDFSFPLPCRHSFRDRYFRRFGPKKRDFGPHGNRAYVERGEHQLFGFR